MNWNIRRADSASAWRRYGGWLWRRVAVRGERVLEAAARVFKVLNLFGLGLESSNPRWARPTNGID